jgi:hypothetical protein
LEKIWEFQNVFSPNQSKSNPKNPNGGVKPTEIKREFQSSSTTFSKLNEMLGH